MTDNKSKIDDLKSRLVVPSGNSPFVRLDFKNHYFSSDFIDGCLDEVEKKIQISSIDSFSNLEKLAFYVLLDTADLEMTEKWGF